MSDPGGFSAGEIGGIVAGAVTLLATFGAGFKWLMNWRDRQRDSFYQKNLAWEERLKAREAQFEADQRAHFQRIEERLDRAERQVEAALNAYHLIAGALRRAEPGNPALSLAEELIKAAFRIDPVAPPDMVARIHDAGAAVEAQDPSKRG